MIGRFETRLVTARNDLSNFAVNLETRAKLAEDKTALAQIGANDRVLGVEDKPITKNRFTASRMEPMPNQKPQQLPQPLQTDEITSEVEELFLKAETKHGITRTSTELKRAAGKILRGDKLLFLKANLMSNYHLLYEVLALAGRRVGVIFLHAPMAEVFRQILPSKVEIFTLANITMIVEVDTLFMENCEVYEDLGFSQINMINSLLQKLPCGKVLVSNLMTYRSFCLLRKNIGVPFSGIVLPGLKVENLTLTSSKDANKSQGLKRFLRQISTTLREQEKVLILTSSQTEANELYKYLASGGELAHFVRLSSIHFGPVNNPPLNAVFSLVIYFSLPKKLDQLFSHISLLYNNFYYRYYGKLTRPPRIRFHLFACLSDFANLRFNLFMRSVARLQVNRLVKRLDDAYKTSNENITKLSLKEAGKFCDLSSSLIVRCLRLCQKKNLVQMNSPYPVSFALRPLKPGKTHPMLHKVLEVATKSSGVYTVGLS